MTTELVLTTTVSAMRKLLRRQASVIRQSNLRTGAHFPHSERCAVIEKFQCTPLDKIRVTRVMFHI